MPRRHPRSFFVSAGRRQRRTPRILAPANRFAGATRLGG